MQWFLLGLNLVKLHVKSKVILYYTPEYFMGFSESLAAYKMLGQFVNLPNESRLLLLCLRTRGSCTDGIQCQCQAGGLLFLELTRPVGAAVARLHWKSVSDRCKTRTSMNYCDWLTSQNGLAWWISRRYEGPCTVTWPLCPPSGHTKPHLFSEIQKSSR